MIAEAEPFEGKYEILEKIREGGMGAVYKVRHRLLDEIRVIKVIRPHLSTSPEMGERFLREARLAIRVRHPNIAQLHDFSVDPDGTAFIVMEYVDGLTLSDVLARMAPLPLGLGLEVARGALDAIGYLHRRSMIHRDISPDNLMLGRDEEGQPHVTLLDLGIAKSLAGSSALTSTGAFLGKPRYASPEHFGAEGLAGVGPSSDLYSFGVVLYELLTGVCPVQGRDTSSWIAGHLFRPPLGFAESDSQGRVPAALQAILLKTLSKAPEERFASAEEMAKALETLRFRFPVEPGALDLALGALHGELAPVSPHLPGTTQDAFDRRFAPIETPLPRSEKRAPTLVLQTQRASAAPEASSVAAPAETTQILPPSAAAIAGLPAPPPRPRLYLVPVLGALLVLILSGGIWWMTGGSDAPKSRGIVKSEAPQPRPAAAPPSPAPSVPEPVEEAPLPSTPERQAVTEPPAIPRPPAEAQVSAPPETRPVPRARPAAVQPSPAKPPETKAPPGVAEVAAAGAPEPAPVSSGEVVQNRELELIEASAPSYPEIARGTGLRAQIYVKVRVDEDGRVGEAKVEKAFAQRGSSGEDPTVAQALAFREAALAAARVAVYRPALRNGSPVRAWKSIVFDFRD